MTRRPVPILFTIPNFITAGSGRVLLNIVQRLDRQRFAPTVCVMRRGGRLDAELERMDVPLIEESFTVAARPYHSLPAPAASGQQVQRLSVRHLALFPLQR